MRALKLRSTVASHWKLTTSNWEHHRSWSSSYNYRRSCWRTQRRPLYGGLHLKQIGKVKKLDKWVPQELTKNKKKLAFLSVISFYSVQQWSDCDVLQNINCIRLPTMTSSMAGLRRSSENGNTCSQHWSTKWAHFFPTMPAIHHTTNASKVEGTSLQSFASSTIFVWPLANWLPLLQASVQLFAGKTPTSRRRSKSLLNPKTWIFKVQK